MLLLEEIAESMSPVGMVAAVIGCALALVLAVLVIREHLSSADPSALVPSDFEEKDSGEHSRGADLAVPVPPPASPFKTYNPTKER